MRRAAWKTLLCAAGLALLALGARADRQAPGRTTAWGHPSESSYSFVRGLAFDGRYIYVADANDYFLDDRPSDGTGRIYVYDLDGNLIRRFPEVPPVRGVNFPHGVAIDGERLWTADFVNGVIYEYEIATGRELRHFPSPVRWPFRFDYQAATNSLWATTYSSSMVYQIGLDGRLISSFDAAGFRGDMSLALDGRGDLWLADASATGGRRFERWTRDGRPLQTGYTDPPFWSIATHTGNRTAGYLRDLPPRYVDARGRFEARFEFVDVETVGGRTTDVAAPVVTCENLTTGQQATAHVGAPSAWNCEDGGLAVMSGDRIRIRVEGGAR